MIDRGDIQRVHIQCKMDQDVVLSLEANKEGPYSVLRKTTGEKVENMMAENKAIFNSLLSNVPDSLLQRKGAKYEFQDIKGKKIDLVISFIGNNDAQQTFQFVYGSDSSQPPSEIMAVVKEALSLQNQIYQSYPK